MNNKKILIVEDIPSVANGIKDRIISCLETIEENINCFYFSDEALVFLESNRPDIIIIDLAMDSVGLSKNERENSVYSRLTGWVILNEHILNGEFKEKLKYTHCYIFSGYAKVFANTLGLSTDDNGVNLEAINQRLSEFRDNLFFVPKVGADGGASELIKAIKDHSIT